MKRSFLQNFTYDCDSLSISVCFNVCLFMQTCSFERGVKRVLYKYGSIINTMYYSKKHWWVYILYTGVDGLESLCTALKLEISDDIVEVCGLYGNKDSLKLQLNTHVCAKILLTWVRKSNDNDGPAMFEVIKAHERKKYRGM